METLLSKHWHHLPSKDVLELFDSSAESGLDLFEVKHRQQRFGANVLTPKKGKSPFVRFLEQFNNPLVYILLVASLVTALVKDVLDAVIIFAVVLINAVIGYIQEMKAERAIEALSSVMITEASVTRSGKTLRLPAAELVPGDIVTLKAGDKIPADLRLIRSRDFQVAEAAITGESLPVQKEAETVLPAETVLAERKNMAYASTLVTYGQASGVVIATGDKTEVGRISQLISSADELATPLTRKIASFSQILLYAILVVAVVAVAIDLWRGKSAIETLMAAVALAVAMIPEGLPAALTVTLAIGVTRMARRRAVIRKLPAVETLGSVTVICTDKTGTLTQNEMTVQQIVAGGRRYSVSGSGYEPSGKILAEGKAIALADEPGLTEVLKAGLLCNDSAVVRNEQSWEVHGDPTEAALLVSGAKGELALETLRQELPRLDEIPFESQHQYMATLHQVGGTGRVVYIKGAAEAILDHCTAAIDANGQTIDLDKDSILSEVDRMAEAGLRVLAFARSKLRPGTEKLMHEDIKTGLCFLGLQGMIDPPRPEAIKAVQACQKAGIQLKMITGDHALTAAAIARQIGLNGTQKSPGEAQQVITGKSMVSMSDEELIEAAQTTAVFARVSPEQKLRLVDALQAKGHVVAMTGDGVNDGPALKQSDIGIAMGITGTEVAKEAADMVLTDDNFATIEAAVEEGRGVFDNLTKIIAWMLPTNLGEGLVILLALFLGVALPILPIQILWINMVTAAVLGIVLALELKEANIMQRPPRQPDAPILTGELLWRVVLVGALILVGSFGLFEWELQSGASLAVARTVAVNAVVTIVSFYLLNCRSLTQSFFRIGVFSNPWVIGGILLMILLQLLFTYIPFMNTLLSSAPIGLESWGRILAMGVISFAVVEIDKWVRRRRQPEAGWGVPAQTGLEI
jgi:Ca2+-transporting ATPase